MHKIGLGFLTLAYFIIEIVINYQIYNQLSVGSTFISIDVMEFWGKIITGLGMALVLTRLFFISASQMYQDSKYEKVPRSTIKTFFFICIATIPASFLLQNWLINTIVDNSDAEERNKAVLVAATHNAVVPFYTFTNTKYNASQLELEWTEKLIYPFIKEREVKVIDFREERKIEDIYASYNEIFRTAADKCVHIGRESMNLDDGLDRVFFSYSALSSGSANNELYKQVITEYYTCMFDNKKFRDAHTANVPYKQALLNDMFWGYYWPGVDKWRSAKNSSLDHANRAWRKGADHYFGFKTTIKPLTHANAYSEFLGHPDVRRYYNENAGPDAKGLFPYDANYKENYKAFLISKLPEAVIPTYTDSDTPVVGRRYNLSYKQMEDIPDEEIESAGKLAYKAVVMPIVALGLSAFFLIFNLVTVGYSITLRIMSKKSALILLLIVLFWFIIYPNVSVLNDYEGQPLLNDQSTIIKTLYFNESILSNFYDWFSG